MYYWRNNSSDNLEANKLKYLFSDHNGTCLAWAKLFAFSLLSQGISDVNIFEIKGIYTNLDDYKKQCLITTKGIFNNGSDKSFDYICDGVEYGCNPFCTTCAPGQNNYTPICSFENHFVVICKNLVYDPSYGTGPFIHFNNDLEESEWEKKSIGGFIIKKQDQKYYIKLNEINKREVLFSNYLSFK